MSQSSSSNGDLSQGQGESESESAQKAKSKLVDGDGVNYHVIRGQMKDSTLIVSGEFAYRIDKPRSGKLNDVYLKCKFYPTNCDARASMRDQVLTLHSEHKCQTTKGTSTAYWDASERTQLMKDRVGRETNPCVAAIVDDELRGASPEVRSMMGQKKIYQQLLYQKRKTQPSSPSTVEELIQKYEEKGFPADYQETYLGFVKVEIGGDVNYAILHGDLAQIEQITSIATEYFCDATFKVAPRLDKMLFNVSCNQVFFCLADYNGGTVCVFAATMTSKKLAVYQAVFEKFHELCPYFKPRIVMMDFEVAMRKAFSSVFVEAIIAACRFHFAQAILSRIKNRLHLASYLSKKSKNEDVLKIGFLMRQIMSLPVIEPRHMVTEMNRISAEMKEASRRVTVSVKARLKDLIDYVFRYWLSFIGTKTISVCGLTHKTNNISESFNGKLGAVFPKHGSYVVFHSCLISHVFSKSETVIAQVEARTIEDNTCRARRVLHEHTRAIELKYRSGQLTPTEYLRVVAAHYDMPVISMVLESSTKKALPEDDAEDPVEEAIQADPGVTLAENWQGISWDEESSVQARKDPTFFAPVCPVCYDAFPNLLVTSGCNHLLCENCYETIKSNRKKERRVCPNCRERFWFVNQAGEEEYHETWLCAVGMLPYVDTREENVSSQPKEMSNNVESEKSKSAAADVSRRTHSVTVSNTEGSPVAGPSRVPSAATYRESSPVAGPSRVIDPIAGTSQNDTSFEGVGNLDDLEELNRAAVDQALREAGFDPATARQYPDTYQDLLIRRDLTREEVADLAAVERNDQARRDLLSSSSDDDMPSFEGSPISSSGISNISISPKNPTPVPVAGATPGERNRMKSLLLSARRSGSNGGRSSAPPLRIPVNNASEEFDINDVLAVRGRRRGRPPGRSNRGSRSATEDAVREGRVSRRGQGRRGRGRSQVPNWIDEDSFMND